MEFYENAHAKPAVVHFSATPHATIDLTFPTTYFAHSEKLLIIKFFKKKLTFDILHIILKRVILFALMGLLHPYVLRHEQSDLYYGGAYGDVDPPPLGDRLVHAKRHELRSVPRILHVREYCAGFVAGF